MLTERKPHTTPGVYLEQIFPAPSPELITGVPAFLGVTVAKNAEPQDANQPKLLKLWPQFDQFFDRASSGSYLAHAVRGFFENGGRLCYVVPLQEAKKEALKQGLAAIESLDTIDLVCAPDIMMRSSESQWVEEMQKWVEEMQKLVLDHCDKMGDRFAILDSLPNKQKITEQRDSLQSNNGALYFPWIKVLDPATQQLIEVPPCGHIAGIYAQSDRTYGFPQTPANYPLEGVLDLSVSLSSDEQDALNLKNNSNEPPSINCLRVFKGRGIRIWGGRTLSQNPDWQYINVRRLFLTVLRWIERNLEDVVFEPNDFKLWVRIERELTTYLESLLRKGALQGRTPQEAFYIKCDSETNPPEMRDIGTVVTEIGLAPTKPNEFIVVRLIHGTAGVNSTTQP
ncbi:phage tail sheath subtilisin-like domain-containing protein [Microcoleus vaginatus]|uniref:phage tail sheath subtilisin-like domain-containing protein n=1 Tax=Microcoleus vaginatus TaxID=119532 RepID=UPI001686F347|nr:phage tail sheath family protein [Microcoleus sp. FACHB-84]